ncbi:MAG: hypothetical protein NTW31_06360 [Bacteroidetes bacterium]|nr:hypothetical protein [Bacteroidota bacterium]
MPGCVALVPGGKGKGMGNHDQEKYRNKSVHETNIKNPFSFFYLCYDGSAKIDNA